MIEIGVGPSDEMYLRIILVGELEEINLFLNDKPIPHKNTKVGSYKLDGWVHVGGKMMFRLLDYQEDYYHVVQFVDNLFYPKEMKEFFKATYHIDCDLEKAWRGITCDNEDIYERTIQERIRILNIRELSLRDYNPKQRFIEYD